MSERADIGPLTALNGKCQARWDPIKYFERIDDDRTRLQSDFFSRSCSFIGRLSPDFDGRVELRERELMEPNKFVSVFHYNDVKNYMYLSSGSKIFCIVGVFC